MKVFFSLFYWTISCLFVMNKLLHIYLARFHLPIIIIIIIERSNWKISRIIKNIFKDWCVIEMSYGSINVNFLRIHRIDYHLICYACISVSSYILKILLLYFFLLLNQTKNMRRAIIKFLWLSKLNIFFSWEREKKLCWNYGAV